MRIGSGERQIVSKIQMQLNVAHAQIVIAQSKGVFEDLIQTHWNALRLVLAGKTQKVLDNAVRALCLLIKLFAVFQALRTHLSAGTEQLAVTENRSERIVQLMCDA